MMVSNNLDPDIALKHACKVGDLKSVQNPLRRKDPNGNFYDATKMNNIAIQLAVETGHSEIMKTLLKWKDPSENGKFVDLTVSDPKSIQIAASRGYLEIMKTLLKWNYHTDNEIFVDPTYSDNLAFKWAVLEGI